MNKKIFIVFSVSVILYFLWADIWMENILGNPEFFFSWAMDENGFFSQETIVFKLNIISDYINIILAPLLKLVIILSGLKIVRIIMNCNEN